MDQCVFPGGLDQVPEGGMDLLLRVPDYAKDYQVRVSEVNGTVRMVTEVTEKGYCRVHLVEAAQVQVTFGRTGKICLCQSTGAGRLRKDGDCTRTACILLRGNRQWRESSGDLCGY